MQPVEQDQSSVVRQPNNDFVSLVLVATMSASHVTRTHLPLVGRSFALGGRSDLSPTYLTLLPYS